MSELDHVIIIGASFAGLGAARVLSEQFDQVTIIERDVIPDQWGPRKGVPQSPHVHGIPKLGRELLETLFPEFVQETQQLGAVLFDQVALGAAWGPFGWSARGTSSAVGYGVRRALLEHVVRSRVAQLPNVSFVNAQVAGLHARGHRVTGVALKESTRSAIEGDLIVDAGGKGSSGPKWLEDAQFAVPDETVVNGFVGYSSRWLRVPEEAWSGTYRYVGQLPTPMCPKGGILYPQDNGLYVMSLFGHARNYPPSEEAEFLDFLTHCATPIMHDVVEQSEPVSEIKTSRSTANRRRHYERIESPPGGYVAIGDALAAFNPIFGQGISSGLIAALMLGDASKDVDGDLGRLPQVFQPRIASWLDVPWTQATGFDFMFPTTVGDRPEPTVEQTKMRGYAATLSQIATVDPTVAEAVLVANQSFNPSLLRTPELEAKAARWIAEERVPPASDPARPPELNAA
jgi:2-polyprenyl-6-methoxyphenol hydroxylase-like FAD-dependent oxidoreductase